jgi:hypothetical protein
MTVTFTLNSIYLGTEAGPFNISGTTDSNATTELTTNLSLASLTSGYTISGIDDNTTGFTIQSVGTCVNYIVKPINSCSCPGGYTASADGSICYKVTTTSPTGNDTLQPEAGEDNVAYGQFGVKIYNLSDYDGTGNSVSGNLAFSGFTTTFDGSSTTSVESFYAGRMNANNVWVAGDSTWPSPTYPDYISFCSTFTISQSKTYYVGIAGDNDVTIKLNGTELVNQADNQPPNNFKFWHVYPVTLNAGPNIIELENWNRSSVGSFAAEIYDNTLNEMTSATSTGMLNIVFATGDYLPGGSKEGEGFCSNYTCPSGYTLDTTDSGNPICKLIETTSCQTVYQYNVLNNENPTLEQTCSNDGSGGNSSLISTSNVLTVGDTLFYAADPSEPYTVANAGYSVKITNTTTGIVYAVETDLVSGEILAVQECTAPSATPTPTATTSFDGEFVAFGSNRTIACDELTSPSTTVYFTAADWNSIQLGDVLYTSDLVTPVGNGYYYNVSATQYLEVVRMLGGEVIAITNCAGATA